MWKLLTQILSSHWVKNPQSLCSFLLLYAVILLVRCLHYKQMAKMHNDTATYINAEWGLMYNEVRINLGKTWKKITEKKNAKFP